MNTSFAAVASPKVPSHLHLSPHPATLFFLHEIFAPPQHLLYAPPISLLKLDPEPSITSLSTHTIYSSSHPTSSSTINKAHSLPK